MTKKILSFIAIFLLVFTSFAPGAGSLQSYAADTESSSAVQISDEPEADNTSDVIPEATLDESIYDAVMESSLPVGGVSEEIAIEVEWNDEWKALASSTKKRGLKGLVETKDPNGTYTSKNDGSGTYGYDNLNEFQKSIYDALKDSVNEFINSELFEQDLNAESAVVNSVLEYTADNKCTFKDLERARTAYSYDNPQQFFWDGNYYLSCSTDGSYSRIGLIVDEYYYTQKSRRDAQDAIDSVGSKWIDEMQSIMSEYSSESSKGEYLAVVYAHNLIIGAVNYAYIENTSTPQDERWAHSIAGVFTGQGVVCEGYAKTFQYLLNICGIDNVYIVGQADTGSGRDSGGHAWNCFCIDGNWYPADLTWDDLGKESDGSDEMWYSYFAIPGSEFNKDHDANNMGYDGMYDIPKFSESDEYSYYKYFNGYGNNSVKDAQSAQNLFNLAAAAKPDFTYYLYFSVADAEGVGYMAQVLKTSVRNWSSPYFGRVFRTEYMDCENPAKEISLSPAKVTVEVGGIAEITATIDENSDDKIAFSLDSNKYCTMSVSGNKVSITGKKNGTAVLTARTVGGKAEAKCTITIGTGIPDPEEINVWQNGGKDYKKIQLVTTLTATKWKDSKGKTKAGKLVWIASDEDIDIEFDREKHKVTTKTKPTSGSVSNKGVVTAKKAGMLYVYCCDTGSLAVERFIVGVLASPSKLLLGKDSSVQDSKDALKKLVLNAGETGKVYICPLLKDGTADEANEYTVSFAKTEQSKYASLSRVKSDEKGGIYFKVSALDFDRSKGKAVSVKVIVVCKQSGKKASLTVTICNPVQGVSASFTTENTTLAKKKNTVSVQLAPITCIDEVTSTTDKLKIYVGNTSVTLDSEGKKVTADKGATVKAKFDAKTMKLTLTAGQDAGETAVVYLAATNSQTKKTTLFSILKVDADGKVVLTGN